MVVVSPLEARGVARGLLADEATRARDEPAAYQPDKVGANYVVQPGTGPWRKPPPAWQRLSTVVSRPLQQRGGAALAIACRFVCDAPNNHAFDCSKQLVLIRGSEMQWVRFLSWTYCI